MADKKVSELVALNKVSQDDLLLVVNDPAGTPTSNKITVGNLFGNVDVVTTHNSIVTLAANATFSGTTVTCSANLVVGGVDVKTGINDKMQVANVTSTYTTNTVFQGYVANTNSIVTNHTQSINDMANTFSTGTLYVGNTFILETTSSDPATSNAANEGITAGTMFYSNTHLYIATDANTIKRVTLGTF